MIRIGENNIAEFPILLAPMEDVSDPPFRSVCKDLGADLMYTEFISTEGLIRNAAKSIKKLEIHDYERPIGIQIFGSNLDAMIQSAQIVDQCNPTLLDINYGCPVKKVVCKEAGAGILKNIPKMLELTKAVINNTKLPVTVKTRLGWDADNINIVDVVEKLQDIGVQAVTIHARTRVQMYKGHSDWSWIAKVKENQRIKIPIFGNGDITSHTKALEYKNKYGVDGIMIGRAAIGNPWIFTEVKDYLFKNITPIQKSIEDIVKVVRKHLHYSIQWKGNNLGILEMRKHYANYFKGFHNAKEFRQQINSTMILEEIDEVLDSMILYYNDINNLNQTN